MIKYWQPISIHDINSQKLGTENLLNIIMNNKEETT